MKITGKLAAYLIAIDAEYVGVDVFGKATNDLFKVVGISKIIQNRSDSVIFSHNIQYCKVEETAKQFPIFSTIYYALLVSGKRLLLNENLHPTEDVEDFSGTCDITSFNTNDAIELYMIMEKFGDRMSRKTL